MRIYDIMLFTFIFTVALSMTDVMALVPYSSVGSPGISGTTTTAYARDSADTAQQVVNQPTSTIPIVGELLSFLNIVYQFVVLGLPKIMLIIADCTFEIQFLLIRLGLPDTIAWLVAGIVWFIYGIGILQYAIGRSLQDSE
jgi:hypothetical protein